MTLSSHSIVVADDDPADMAMAQIDKCFTSPLPRNCDEINNSFRQAVATCDPVIAGGTATESKSVTAVDLSFNGNKYQQVPCQTIREKQNFRESRVGGNQDLCTLSGGAWDSEGDSNEKCISAKRVREMEATKKSREAYETATAEANETQKTTDACNSFNAQGKEDYKFLDQITKETTVNQGGSGYSMCSAATGGEMIKTSQKDLYNPNDFAGLWKVLKEKYKALVELCKEPTDPKKMQDAKSSEKIAELEKLKEEKFKEYKECASIAAVVSYAAKEYDDNKDLLSMEKAISADGQVTCTRGTGAESQDFPGCVSMITAYDVFFVSEYALNAAQPLLYQSEMSKSQIEHSKPVGTDSGAMIAPTAGLKIQKDSLDSQSDMAQQKAAFHATKAAALAGFMNSLPSREELVEQCGKKRYNDLQNTMNVPDCNQALHDHQSTFLNNTKAKDKVKAAMIKAGVDSAVNMYQKNLLDDQSGKVSGVITAIDQYNPAAYAPAAGENLMLEKCQANPSDPACLNTADSYQGFSGQSFNFTGGGGNTSLSAATPTLDMTQFGDGSASQSRMAAGPEAIGGIGATADKGPSGIIGTPITGAASSALGQAQGGGGLALGGAAPPSGGGSSGGEPQAPAPTNPTASKISYEEGRVSMSGGSGLLANRKKGSEKENPFADLIGKKDGKSGPKGGILNFRDPASEKELGSSDKGLFMRLSESYGKIVTSKRLLEYEERSK